MNYFHIYFTVSCLINYFNNRSGKSRDDHEAPFLLRENEKPAFTNSSGFKSVYKSSVFVTD